MTMEMARRQMTNVAAAGNRAAPMGQFIKMRDYPRPEDRSFPAPNADTLYTMAWLDLGPEPWALTIPDMGQRYFMMPMLSGWTEVFASPGSRTSGTGRQAYLVSRRAWKGKVPEGMTRVDAPTDMVWIAGRIYSSGDPSDLSAAQKLQDQLELVPLSQYGKSYTPKASTIDPSFDLKTGVRDQVGAMDGATFFNLLSALLVQNPPATADAPMIARLADIGVVPGSTLE